jgi:small-conductance mechanosensitive channel
MTLQGLWLSIWQSGAGIWLITAGLKLLVIIIGAIVAQIIITKFIRGILQRIIARGSGSKAARLERINTLTTVFSKTVALVIFVVALLMVFSQLGINIMPILTGAGIVGIAIGFGAQDLVKNIFAGIFILLEDQFSEGDTVSLAGIEGKVEDFDLRRTVVRDSHNTQHYIPNGEIRIVANKSK